MLCFSTLQVKLTEDKKKKLEKEDSTVLTPYQNHLQRMWFLSNKMSSSVSCEKNKKNILKCCLLRFKWSGLTLKRQAKFVADNFLKYFFLIF